MQASCIGLSLLGLLFSFIVGGFSVFVLSILLVWLVLVVFTDHVIFFYFAVLIFFVVLAVLCFGFSLVRTVVFWLQRHCQNNQYFVACPLSL